ncbi:ATP-binding cassette domain-containing protein [Spiroplasma turonicum]|uniref:ABC transporter ATP-binding protein n=1 Tax=Spiroplasma turonicum TaxID=216946 RepID=A0A0K1P8F9_9MOLU|nr:ABC transporter ATP-binding protein [Spiroplasma turonicum]AKU80187.1 ABC transporter ATP-binding protein [Spiroplasma turonicum]ALX71187.1 ABC transporter ATP-binding protein [Spiroplasma turonicum]
MTKVTNKYWYLIFMYLILSIISNAGIVYGGYKFSSIVEGLFANDIDYVLKQTYILIGAFIIGIVFYYFSELMKVFTVKKLNLQLKKIIVNKINNLSDKEYAEYKKGELLSWLTKDFDSINKMIFSGIFSICDGSAGVVLSCYAIFNFHWIIGLSLFGITILMFILPSILQPLASKKAEKLSKSNEEFVKRIENLLNGYTVFSYSNKKNVFNRLFNLENIKVEKATFSYGNIDATQKFVLFSLMIVSQLVLMLLTMFLSLNNMTEKGAMLSVANLSGTYFQAVNSLFGSLFTLRAGRMISKKFKIKEKDINYETKNISFDSLKLKNLSYKINNKVLFHNLDLEIERQKKYLIIGDSGKGKTTLFKILFGLVDDYNGEIILNEKFNYKDLNINDLRNLIAYLPQDISIFNDTLKNNLTLFNDDISEEKIINVLKKVNLSKLLENNGLDKIINSESKNMSGGELQRIVIARALLQDKDIMILDEITSSLDLENRKNIEELICKLNKTVLFISHTANTSDSGFDKIIQL